MVLVSLEGIDGSGKSSLHHALSTALSDLSPVMTCEPGATWVGDPVRKAIALHADPLTQALLFVADHAAHLATVIRPALADNRLIITDRFIDSRFAYQGVQLRSVVPDPSSWLAAVHEGWTILPDLTFLLIISPENALERISDRPGRDQYEECGFLTAVQEQYLCRVEEDSKRFVLIDATKEPDELVSFVAESIRERFYRGQG